MKSILKKLSKACDNFDLKTIEKILKTTPIEFNHNYKIMIYWAIKKLIFNVINISSAKNCLNNNVNINKN